MCPMHLGWATSHLHTFPLSNASPLFLLVSLALQPGARPSAWLSAQLLLVLLASLTFPAAPFPAVPHTLSAAACHLGHEPHTGFPGASNGLRVAFDWLPSQLQLAPTSQLLLTLLTMENIPDAWDCVGG